MIWFQAAILGLIQALTEFLPVSSSGHLLIARSVLDFDIADGLAFDVALHVGTLVAIVLYFRRDIAALARGLVRSVTHHDASDPQQLLGWAVVVGCVPAAIVGFFFENAIEVYFRHPGVVVVTLVAGALLFFAAERVWRSTAPMESLTLGGALFIGVAQVLALIPGVSRSGITIVAGMARGLRRDEAARFSFLMAAPLLAGAGVKAAMDVAAAGPLAPGEASAFAVGASVSALAGWFVVKFLLGFLRRHSLDVFAWYRLALAAVIAAWLWL